MNTTLQAKTRLTSSKFLSLAGIYTTNANIRIAGKQIPEGSTMRLTSAGDMFLGEKRIEFSEKELSLFLSHATRKP